MWPCFQSHWSHICEWKLQPTSLRLTHFAKQEQGGLHWLCTDSLWEKIPHKQWVPSGLKGNRLLKGLLLTRTASLYLSQTTCITEASLWESHSLDLMTSQKWRCLYVFLCPLEGNIGLKNKKKFFSVTRKGDRWHKHTERKHMWKSQDSASLAEKIKCLLQC